MSKDLDNFTGADSDSFEKGIHLEGEGSWKPLYPEELNRPLRHIEIDYNFKVLSSTLAGYRVFPSGNTPSNHLSVEDFSNDANKILKLKKDGNDYYWTLEQISSSSGSNDGVSLPAYDSLNDKVLKVINGGLSWEQDNFEAAITNTGSLSDFPTYSTTQNDKVLKVKNGALSWEADLEGTSGVNLPSYTSTENGKVLKVVGGNLTWSDDLQGDSGVSLPDTTNQDGKVLKVVGGVLQWADDNYEADTDTISVKRIEVKSPSSGVYSFNEYGQNANIVLERGNAYIFDWSGATSHPFRIVSTTAGGYNSQNDLGQTENWIEYNDLEYKTTVAIPWNYNGANLYYICQAHPAMNGTINVVNSELPQ